VDTQTTPQSKLHFPTNNFISLNLTQGTRAFKTRATTYKRSNTMAISCPQCQSTRIETKNYGRKTGRAIGSVAGAAAGAAGAMGGAEIGATAGAIGGPAGAVLGGFFGAIIGGLVGASAGGAVGEEFGVTVDDGILDNYHCLVCDHSFSQHHTR
jgi:hypothetical protein